MISKSREKIWFVTSLIVILLILTIIARAQDLKVYLVEFQTAATTYDVSLLRSEPRFEIDEEPLYIMYDERTIEVDAYTDFNSKTIYFNSISTTFEENLKVLVFHELGHYYLNKPHTTTQGIMNIDMWSYTSWESLSPRTQTIYIQELFK